MNRSKGMIAMRTALVRTIGWLSLLVAGLIAGEVAANKGNLVVAISNDIPPYVTEGARSGLEVDLVKAALRDYQLRFVQMDYGQLAGAVENGQVDVAVGVQDRDQGIYYSRPFITFVNYAISKKADHLQIDSVADMAGHPVFAWPDAWRELSPAFTEQYAPASPQRRFYREFPEQSQQVTEFWQTEGAVVVIDITIFKWMSEQQGHAMNAVSLHNLFPPVTRFRAGFATEAVRDDFEVGMADLCDGGAYEQILARYKVDHEVNPCVN